jgi:hypothetical protein
MARTAPSKTPAPRKTPAAKPQVAAKAAPVKAKATPVKAKAPAAKPVEAAAKPAPVAKAKPAVVADKPVKLKHKLVRDSFTMPKADFDLIAVLKERALGFRQPVKKSELLRAGLRVLNGLPDAALKGALGSLEALKPGRPKNEA